MSLRLYRLQLVLVSHESGKRQVHNATSPRPEGMQCMHDRPNEPLSCHPFWTSRCLGPLLPSALISIHSLTDLPHEAHTLLCMHGRVNHAASAGCAVFAEALGFEADRASPQTHNWPEM
ncbi:unnamed protein product [Protopolystoma xenopodis]|uniref:Uncharacterized protein n=1 Tax=Protopolystoma xenopodis TaxID=117903 RepID=A0A448XMB1_9PLAT|nr:unnamed protein product [Protopolystoma xenopodis]